MKNFLDTKVNVILTIILIVLSIIIVIQAVFSSGVIKSEDVTAVATTDEISETIIAQQDTTVAPTTEKVEPKTTAPTQKATKKPDDKKSKNKSTQQTTKAKATTVATTALWATAIPPKTAVDYNSQWAAGYLVAIDNPDKSYACSKVTLSDEDRDLLERLCMGEFGSGGFVGASLIAQAVKNAMCFDGYSSVQSVITNCHYTGSTKIPANSSCIKAVEYIFDNNKDAVQHRIMYMYNPNLVQSTFHESQNYILTYSSVRFFDRWGY